MKLLMMDRFPNTFVESLLDMGVEVIDLRAGSVREVTAALPEAEIILMNSKISLTPSVIDSAPHLKMVLRAGVGMDHIDQDYLQQKGVAVHNAQGGNADAVGEHAVGMLLALRHHLMRANAQVKNFVWQREPNRGHELGGKTIGIIGYGHTGQAVARKLSGFGPRVLVYDKYRNDYGDAYATVASLEQIYAEAEVISFHVPLTEETRHWVNPAFFEQLAHPIYVLNLSRGAVVDLKALNVALDEGKVIAAGLDVLPNEKLKTLNEAERAVYEALFARENVILSPHIGGWTVESRENINQMMLEYVRGLVQKR